MLLASLALVFAFVAVTGLSPSILRATCVVLILQLCWYFGKQVRPLVVIALAAAITAMIDPSQVWRSVGWYLSFAAFFGILVLAPLANKEMRPTVSVDLEKNPHPFRSLVTESIAALVMTAPIIVLIFGRFSLVALPTNILVAPLVPLAMLTSFIAGLAGMLVPIVSGLVGLPATAVLTLILDIANIAARLPGAVVEVSLQWYWLLIFYGVLCGAAFFAYRIRSNRNALRS